MLMLPESPTLPVKLIAFYLPQYHPIPENDEWWGTGFTDWTNVAQGRPRFVGHDQPRIPADLGFYDLRVTETRELQAQLARQHGIYGFCYYHYWFGGRRLLERPFTEVLSSGRPDFPFCLCWANENWTRRWDGLHQQVLLGQNYSAQDDLAHIRSLIPALTDPRYIRVDSKPLLLIYRISQLPEPRATIECWQREIRKAGLPGLFLCNVESMPSDHGLAKDLGLDAAVEFAPDWTCLPPAIGRTRREALRYVLKHRRRRRGAFWQDYVADYEQLASKMMAKPEPAYLRFPGVTPMWDNSARRQTGAIILHGSSPCAYEKWLRNAVERARNRESEERIVFINAWNEWAEGSYLEPCQRWGRAYLEATRRALDLSPSEAITSESPDVRQAEPVKAHTGTPLVSVIMPVYRGEKFVATAIESVLAQTYRAFELIIVNDGSPDNSADVISRFLPHPQIRYVERANGGVAAARNTGLAHATGTLIALVDQDDEWLPTKLERQVAYLLAHPDVGLVHSSVECMDATGAPCSCMKAIAVLPLQGRCAGQLLLGNGIAPLTVLIRKACIDDVGGFDQEFAPVDDWELWLRIARRYAFGFMHAVTARYRVHDDMVSKDRFKMEEATLALMSSICERFPDIPSSVRPQYLARARGRALVSAAEALERRRRHTEAREYWKKAYGVSGDIDALLALLGISSQWRARLQLRGTTLRRVTTWYMYKMRMAAARLHTSGHQ